MTAPLSQRMRQAADALQEFNAESDLYTPDAPWRPSELRREAAHREAEEREAQAQVEELSRLIDCAYKNNKIYDAAWIVRKLVESGWRKGETA